MLLAKCSRLLSRYLQLLHLFQVQASPDIYVPSLQYAYAFLVQQTFNLKLTWPDIQLIPIPSQINQSSQTIRASNFLSLQHRTQLGKFWLEFGRHLIRILATTRRFFLSSLVLCNRTAAVFYVLGIILIIN
jgi:hypothetical protein